MSVSIIVVTYNRPDYLANCLISVSNLDKPCDEIIVIDSSSNKSSETLCHDLNGIQYFKFAKGAGNMTAARNYGASKANGTLIAFLDDDVTLERTWLQEVEKAFSDENIMAACGRTVNGLRDDTYHDDSPIGQVNIWGELIGNFDLRTRDIRTIEHGIGANMIFRSKVFKAMGGFRDDFPGTSLREDTDMFLRLKRLEHVSVFIPEAIAYHAAAPHIVGKRFDSRYHYWAIHNHMLLLGRNYGLFSKIFTRWVFKQIVNLNREGNPNSILLLSRKIRDLLALSHGLANLVIKLLVLKIGEVRKALKDYL